MRKLAKLIETELEKQEICAVYNSHLGRVWPKSMSAAKRMQQIKRFARQHELAVTFYDVGLCAIFEKAKVPARGAKRVLMLDSEGQVSSDAHLESEGAKPSRKRRS
ncbi:MAG TPA: hypothetical protein VNX27_04865 [Chthoniobacterales bacterium]|jgi:hypothetical protein|nr:hypothetical protein [Chthoniobacterales bacterium]